MESMYKHLNQVVNRTWNYAGKLKTERDHVLNAVLGLAGEAGEVADHHKKLYYHKTKADNLEKAREELKLELGDVIYYWLKVCDLYNLNIGEILEANREKLHARHPELWEV